MVDRVKKTASPAPPSPSLVSSPKLFKLKLPLIIGIAGGSGSGKTFISKALLEQMTSENINASLLSMDSYYKNLDHLPLEQRAKTNFDHPDAFETSLLIEHLEMLKAGSSVEVPVYDFDTHTRRKNQFVRMHPPNVIILEGILLFTQPKLVELIDIKVFVSASADIRLIRRLTRDIAERGRSAVQVCQQYMETVREMHSTFVEPSKDMADIIIPNDRDESESFKISLDLLVAFASPRLSAPALKRIKV